MAAFPMKISVNSLMSDIGCFLDLIECGNPQTEPSPSHALTPEGPTIDPAAGILEQAKLPKTKTHKKKKTEWSCFRCEKLKRSCDKARPSCSRCAESGHECVYRNEAIRAKSEVSQGCADSAMVAISVAEMTRAEMLMDLTFINACLTNFDKNMGVLFSFQKELMNTDLSQLYSTPSRSVRTDSALACVCRGMGWVDQAELYVSRAHQMASTLSIDGSEEAFMAITLLGLTSIGGDLQKSKLLLGRSVCMRHPEFELDLNRSFDHYIHAFFTAFASPVTLHILSSVIRGTVQRVQVRAKGVRRALKLRLSPEDLKNFGPYDYSDFRQNFESEEEIDDESGRRRLRELDETEERLQSLLPSVSEVAPDLARITLERFTITGNATRAAVLLHLGEFDAAKSAARVSVSAFGSISSTMWFFHSFVDVMHILDVGLCSRDQDLFERAMALMRKMAPVVPIAEKVVYALMDPVSIFGPWETSE